MGNSTISIKEVYMIPFPSKRVRQSLLTGLRYEHVYTAEEQKEYYTRVADGENADRVMMEIDKRLTEEDWILVTND